MNSGFHIQITTPFVIPTEAQRSGGTCGSFIVTNEAVGE